MAQLSSDSDFVADHATPEQHLHFALIFSAVQDIKRHAVTPHSKAAASVRKEAMALRHMAICWIRGTLDGVTVTFDDACNVCELQADTVREKLGARLGVRLVRVSQMEAYLEDLGWQWCDQ